MLLAAYTNLTQRSDAYRLLALLFEEAFRSPCPEIAKDAHGKPYFPSRPDLHFSISHSRTLALAVLSDAPCGCDVEDDRPVRENVITRVCAPSELEEFSFFELWTLKESFYKLLGRTETPLSGLIFRRDGPEIVPPDPSQHARLYRISTSTAAIISASAPPDAIKYLQFQK